MFRDRLIYRLFIVLIIFSAIIFISIYAVTSNEIEQIKKGADPHIVEQHFLDDLISITFYTFFLSFLLSLFLSQKVLQPVRELYKGALSIKEGNLTTIPEFKTYDEISEVIHAFNEMSLSLREKTEELKRTNLQIKSAKDFLETVMDSIKDEIVIIDREKKIVMANRVFLNKYLCLNSKSSVTDIRGTNCYSVFHTRGESCDIEDCPANIVFETGKIHKTIHSHFDNGHSHHYEITASPIFDQEGKVLYVIELLRDITEQVRHNNELKRKNRVLKDLYSIAELLTAALTDKTAIQKVVSTMANILEMDDGGIYLIDEKANEIVCYFTDMRFPVGNDITTMVINSGKSHILSNPDELNSFISNHIYPLPHWSPDSAIKALYCIPLRGRDKIIGALCLYGSKPHSITEDELAILKSAGDLIGITLEGIKLYEELDDLRLTEKGLAEMVFNSIGEGLYTVDNNLVITSANRAAEKILGLPIRELIGKRCSDIIARRNIDTNEIRCETGCSLKAFVRGDVVVVEANYLRPDNKEIYLRVVCSPLKDSRGNVVGAVEVFSDITKEKEIDRMKTEFVKTVSHEFRTPLSAMIGMTEMLLDEDISGERAKDYLEIIRKESQRLSDMVSELLDLSRIESEGFVLKISEIDFNLIIHDIKESLSNIMKKKKIQLETFIENDVKSFKGDSDRLKQLLINLITNSITYSNEGSKIDIYIKREKDKLIIRVADTGWGIPEEDLPHLTKKFYRGKHGIRTKGTGLGLAICKEIARLHGGDLSIVSSLGKGTLVTVELPFREEI